MLENGAALFINGCSIFKLENGAAPFINGASLYLEPNIYKLLILSLQLHWALRSMPKEQVTHIGFIEN